MFRPPEKNDARRDAVPRELTTDLPKYSVHPQHPITARAFCGLRPDYLARSRRREHAPDTTEVVATPNHLLASLAREREHVICVFQRGERTVTKSRIRLPQPKQSPRGIQSRVRVALLLFNIQRAVARRYRQPGFRGAEAA